MAQAAYDIRAIWPYKSQRVSFLPPSGRTERCIGLRARTEFPVLLCEGPHAAHCLALELSATGVVVRRRRELSEREQLALFKLELFIPESPRPVRVLARVARRTEPGVYALRFVMISDVDRLTLMEHLDREQRDSLELLHEVERSS
ncbi:MAG TPA: hypothetical protein VJN18_13745 [Polyangiaceae bacterium]|nr:hypothetical protein [Polyangiaceae bacterium]